MVSTHPGDTTQSQQGSSVLVLAPVSRMPVSGHPDKHRCGRQQRPRFKFSTCHAQPWASGSSPVNWEKTPPGTAERSEYGNTQR